MKIKTTGTAELIETLDNVLALIDQQEEKQKQLLGAIHPNYYKSARNLIHYRAFRTVDLKKSQRKLRNLGLTRLANSEPHVKASLLNTRYILYSLLGRDMATKMKAGLSIKKGRSLLVRHTKQLLGNRAKGRRVRIMVTQPAISATDYDLVLGMVKSGMNCARINCAHDNPTVWKQIINNIKKAEDETGKKVKIAMDLAGPKIRTGSITPGPKVQKFSPKRNDLGMVVKPAEIYLVDTLEEGSGPNGIPIGKMALSTLKVGDELMLSDTRGKHRQLVMIRVEKDHALAHCKKTVYIATGMALSLARDPSKSFVVGEMPAVEKYLLLHTGDILEITKNQVMGTPEERDAHDKVLTHAVISCSAPAVFDAVRQGDPILFDDGKIEGIIETTHPERFLVRITRAKLGGGKLKAEKGINFPKTYLGISGLTQKDIADLEFVAKYADIVNFSFVNHKKDVEDLIFHIKRLGVFDTLGIILKIETQAAFDHLSEIILAAMQAHQIGVMIARGDLAIETGWQHIGRIQDEILTLCSAAHVPVVWATQVLENLAKSGLPSRSEITDVATSVKAECVMLNKGPYILNAIQLLAGMYTELEHSQEKKERMLPKLH